MVSIIVCSRFVINMCVSFRVTTKRKVKSKKVTILVTLKPQSNTWRITSLTWHHSRLKSLELKTKTVHKIFIQKYFEIWFFFFISDSIPWITIQKNFELLNRIQIWKNRMTTRTRWKRESVKLTISNFWYNCSNSL